MAIVFGTKLLSESDAFAEVAALFAKRLGVPLRLVHVCEDPRAPVVLGTDEERILGSVREALTQETVRLSTLLGIQVQPHLASGSVVDALVSVAEWEVAEALFVASSRVPSRNPMGGVPERVSSRSRVPVVTLRDSDRLREWLRGDRALRVLVGADLGRAAEAARSFAARLGGLGPCEVEVVHVASPRDVHARLGLEPAVSDHVLSAQAEESLLRELLRSGPPDEHPPALRVLPARGSADAYLVALADEGDFDLIVVGQRRRSLLEELWYGSVARGVLHAAPVSVACVPPGLGATASTFHSPQVVVVGIDFSESSQRALTQAVGLVADGGVVHAAHVLPPAMPAPDARTMREQAWYKLSTLARGDASDVSRAVEQHILEGAPGEQLLALAERVGADLVVIGGRSRHAISRAVLGSVARVVCERTRVPVLLVPLPPI